MTVASGSGLDVAEVGRKMPVAVFWTRGVKKMSKYSETTTDGLGFEPLDQDAV
jgi:hypothetical protein